MTKLSDFTRKSLALFVSAALLFSSGGAWAQTVSQAPVTPMPGVIVPGLAGAKVFEVKLADLKLGNLAAVTAVPTALPNVKAAPAVAPSALKAVAQTAAAAPVAEVFKQLQRSGAVLPETLDTPADVAQLKAAAQALPEGPARENLIAFADALSAPKGSRETSVGRIFENSGVKAVPEGLMPSAEAPQAKGGWAKAARSRLLPSSVRRYAADKAEAQRPKASPVGEEKFRVPADKLRWTPKDSDLPSSTAEVPLSDAQVVGQDRALEALRFGLKMKGPGYNVVVTGPSGSGRMTSIRHLIGQVAPKMDTPPDLVAMTNVADKDQPVVLQLQPGKGAEFQAGVASLFETLQAALPQALNSGTLAEMKAQLEGQAKTASRARKAELDAETAAIQLDAKGEFGMAVQVRQTEEGVQILLAPTYKGKPMDEKTLKGLIGSGAISQADWTAAQSSLEEKGAPVLAKYKQMLLDDQAEAAAVARQMAELDMRAAQQLVAKLAAPLAALITPGASHSDAAHKKFQQRARQRQAELDASAGTLKAGRFEVRIRMVETPQGYAPTAAVTLEGEALDADGLAQRVKDGVLKQEEVEALQEAIQKAAKAYVQAFKGVLEQNNIDHQALHANDPKPTPEAAASISYLKRFLGHVAANYELFVEGQTDPNEAYRVSVLASNRPGRGAPVVMAQSASFESLFGSAERKVQTRAIPGVGVVQEEAPGGPALKGGAFHQANGGFLIIRMDDLLHQPGAWEGLSQAIRSGAASIVEGGLQGFAQRAGGYAVPSQTKVILVGSPTMKMMLERYDPSFRALFSASSEFDSKLDISAKSIGAYLDYMKKAVVRSAGEVMDLTRGAIGAVLEYAAKMTGSNDKLAASIGAMGSVLKESSFYAKEAGRDVIDAADVEKALSSRSEREGAAVRHYRELFANNVFMAATDGYVTGQINGLAVMGDFGVPSRITVTVGAGDFSLVSIDQDAKFTGQTFDKALGTVEGFLKGTFGKTKPLAGAVRIGFEQNYGGIDGDSATSTKIYAILSALSGAPIYQGIAVTGSADQFGNVQPIGGANEKISGVYALAKARGLNGKQGVIIPASNVSELMLKPEIVEAVKAGQFHIWAVEHVSQGIEILTGQAYSEILRKADARMDQLRGRAS
ncbi:MAG TPA: hypothetical protein DCM05_01960 [Elusimicrobia bacterium]|nr:hypothetical protein [Elusimicrobiota bacterium]